MATSAVSRRAGSLHVDPLLAAERLRGRASGENFPVALRFLPKALREDLLAVYATARLIDEVGDSATGDRCTTLDELEADLRASFEGHAEHAILVALTPTIRRRSLTREPFLRLIDANRFDQSHPNLVTWDDLLRYCTLSANPVGELVLQIFASATPERIALSNDVCSALQVIEHCQDVREDALVGRRYMPRVDREALGCMAEELVRVPASAALRRVVSQQVDRARDLLASGTPLVASLRGAARVAVSGFVAGGLAACDALESVRFDPNSSAVRPRRRDIARCAGRLYLATGRS